MIRKLVLITVLAAGCGGISAEQVAKDSAAMKADYEKKMSDADTKAKADIAAAEAKVAAATKAGEEAAAKAAEAEKAANEAAAAAKAKTAIALAGGQARAAQSLTMEKKFDDAKKAADEAQIVAKANNLPAAIAAIDEGIAGLAKKDVKVAAKFAEAAGFLEAAAK